jgi:hypothetical protein
MAPTETEVAPAPPEKSILRTSQSEVDDWVGNVDEVSQQIKDILDGTITDFDAFDKQQNLKQRAKEIRIEDMQAKRERRILYGTEGKGEGKNYKWWCKRCFVEYTIDLQDNKCTRCKQSDKMMTPEQRREDLMAKLDVFRESRNKHQWRKDKWLRWKKSQAMLKRSRNINYKAWEYWEPDTETEDEGDPIVPRDNPEFLAMEADMKSRNKKQSERSLTANKCRERGNECMKQGDFLAAIENYEEGLEYRKDVKAIWTNKALAEIKLFRWHDAVMSCNKVIEYSEIFEDGFTKSRDACFKAFMRRATALRALQKWEEALEDCEDAVKLFPKDREAIDLCNKTRIAVEEAAKAQELLAKTSDDCSKKMPEPCKPDEVKAKEQVVAPQMQSDGSVRVAIEESDDDEEDQNEPMPSVHSGSLAGLNKQDFNKLMERLRSNATERTIFCSRRQGDSVAFAKKKTDQQEKEGRKVVFKKTEEVPDASGLDNLLKDLERCSILWRKHQGKNADEIADKDDAEEVREAFQFLQITVDRALDVLYLLASSSDHHCELSASAIRHVWPLASSSNWRYKVLQILMEWSQRSVSARSLAEFASRYPKPHLQIIVEAATEEKKENVLPPGFDATAREATRRLEKGDQSIDQAFDDVLKGLSSLSPAELAVSTLGNMSVVGHALPAFKEQMVPYRDQIIDALASHLRALDWRLCGRAAGTITNLLRLGDSFIDAVQDKCVKPIVAALKEESSGQGPMAALQGLGGRLPVVNATARLLSALVNLLVLRPKGVALLRELEVLPIIVPLIDAAPGKHCGVNETRDEDSSTISARALTIAGKLIQEAPESMSLSLESEVLRRVDKIVEHGSRSLESKDCTDLESSLDAVDLALRILAALVTKRSGVLDRLTEKAPKVQELPNDVDSIDDLKPAISFAKLTSRLMKMIRALKLDHHVTPDEGERSSSRIRGNLALLFSRFVDAQADTDAPPSLKELNFESIVEIFLDWLRKERGPVQQNVGVVLTRLALSPQYRQRVRDLNGMESLHQIMLPKVEKQNAEASRLHRLKSERGLI